MATNTGAFNMNVEMGFCFRLAATTGTIATTRWDCQQVRTTVDPKSQEKEYLTNFELVDMYWSSATVPTTIPKNFVKDSDWISNDQDKNWKAVSEMNSKTSCEAVIATGTTYWCKELNSHFVRNWVTTAASATPDNQDVQLTVAMKDQMFDVFGWMASYSTKDYTGTPLAPRIGTIKQTKFVFNAYKTASEVTEAKRKADSFKKGAVSITTSAAVFAATVYVIAL